MSYASDLKNGIKNFTKYGTMNIKGNNINKVVWNGEIIWRKEVKKTGAWIANHKGKCEIYSNNGSNWSGSSWSSMDSKTFDNNDGTYETHNSAGDTDYYGVTFNTSVKAVKLKFYTSSSLMDMTIQWRTPDGSWYSGEKEVTTGGKAYTVSHEFTTPTEITGLRVKATKNASYNANIWYNTLEITEWYEYAS